MELDASHKKTMRPKSIFIHDRLLAYGLFTDFKNWSRGKRIFAIKNSRLTQLCYLRTYVLRVGAGGEGDIL